MEKENNRINDISFDKQEMVCIQMGVMALKLDLEKNDPDKITIPSLYIDRVWEKIQKI